MIVTRARKQIAMELCSGGSANDLYQSTWFHQMGFFFVTFLLRSPGSSSVGATDCLDHARITEGVGFLTWEGRHRPLAWQTHAEICVSTLCRVSFTEISKLPIFCSRKTETSNSQTLVSLPRWRILKISAELSLVPLTGTLPSALPPTKITTNLIGRSSYTNQDCSWGCQYCNSTLRWKGRLSLFFLRRMNLRQSFKQCDIWSLGITCIELAELQPPLHEIAPMTAVMQIPKNPPPVLKNPRQWCVTSVIGKNVFFLTYTYICRSPEFNDFLKECFIKDPAFRQSAKALLNVRASILFAF